MHDNKIYREEREEILKRPTNYLGYLKRKDLSRERKLKVSKSQNREKESERKKGGREMNQIGSGECAVDDKLYKPRKENNHKKSRGK